MQRAATYLSIFISDFDIEDPDHDLAGFGDAECDQDGGRNKADDAGSVSSESTDGVFAPDRHQLHVGHDRVDEDDEEGEAEKRWSVSNVVCGHDSPSCPTSCTQTQNELEEMKKLPSSRSAGFPIEPDPQRWLTWLRRRWSPLKDSNLKMLMQQEGHAPGLLSRYLTEQTFHLESTQAELIGREMQEACSVPRCTLRSLECQHIQFATEGEATEGDAAQAALSACGHLGDEPDEALSHNCGDTSLSDGEEHKAGRQARLSEASTAKFNPNSVLNFQKEEPKSTATCESVKREKTERRSSFFSMGKKPSRDVETVFPSCMDTGGLNMDGLEELWHASNAYNDSWAKHSHAVHNERVSSGCQHQ